MRYRVIRRAAALAALLIVLPGLVGCPAIVRGPQRGQVLQRDEPVSGQLYELYVPSSYSPDRPAPLIVTCHGTLPFDSAKLQIREWTDIAEQQGLIIAAPVLTGTKARSDTRKATVEDQIRRQRVDEQTILATVNHVRAGYNIDPGRVYLTGWSAGSYAVLWTGLSHPEVFRALAVRQGNFDPKFFEPLAGRLDTSQHVVVFYGQVDLLRPQAMACVEWLREHEMPVFADEIVGAHRRVPDLAYKYLAGITKAYPWLVVRYRPGWGGEPLKVRLWAKVDPDPAQPITWSLGDGQSATGTAVTHTYATGGTYDVTVRAPVGRKGPIERTVRVTVAPAAGGAAPDGSD